MSIRIRPATALDAPAVAAVHRASWEDTYRSLLTEEAIARHTASMDGVWQARLADPGATTTWVAVDEDIVGFLLVEAMGPGHPATLRVGGLYLLPRVKRRGYGRALLEYAIADVPAYTQVAVANRGAIDFWRALGFNEVSTEFDEGFGADLATLVRE
ncbi:GNAT family N-acetyltransferase [Trueperella pecoris]|uniref:GNAT family N-acetyltransferase n=1 Tax=Trueperella pecoris TaxID=2733571 RepID=A0A7M1QYH9_9ACTO|nr:GNAT family N-acetyltransferase [Trueperella pecoris]QOR47008.1 GNAT family N-acetyltransferase [Trueperella pecoris]